MTLTVNRAVPSSRLSLLAALGLPLALSAQVEVNSTLTPEQYVNDVLLGTGVEATNVQFTGSPMQIGEITGFDPADFPIEAGLILSTEVANNPANVDDGCVDDFIDDNLEVLHGSDENAKGTIEYIKERANIQFKSLNFMRGRSFNNAYIIIDEAQGLTQFQLKSIITRVGSNSKIVVLGNLAQIDNKYISPLTSGLTYLVEKSKYFEHAAIMHVNGVERSRLAAFAETHL